MASTAVSGVEPYIVCWNRLADAKLGPPMKQFEEFRFKTRPALENYVLEKTQLAEPSQSAKRSNVRCWQVGLDRVGVLRSSQKPAVQSFRLNAPRAITRRTKTRSTQEWDQTLHGFLSRNMAKVTLGHLVTWYGHAKNLPEAQDWLVATKNRPTNISALREEIQSQVGKQVTAEMLVEFLEVKISQARLLAGRPHSDRHGKIAGWCRAVNREVLGKEDVQTRMVWPPGKKTATTRSRLCFRQEYNYLLVDER